MSPATRARALLLFAAACGGAPDPPPAASARTYRNPVVADDCPDPGVLGDGGAFYAVCTGGDATGASNFPLRRSTDLVTWRSLGYLFPAGTTPGWAKADFWAPEVHRIGQRYVLYFTARDRSGRLSIGVATAPAVTGPWTDSGAPLVHDERAGMIDPHQFQDRDGVRYLFWKADGNAFHPPEPTPIFVQRLSPDGLALAGERTTALVNDQPWEGAVVEGASMVRHGGWYYLFYSGNAYNSDRYAVGVARARSPLGPFEKRPAPILATGRRWVGPGHGSLVAVGASDWYVYHAWQPGKVDHPGDPNHYPRMMLIDRVSWRDGWPIVNDGRPSSGPMPSPSPR